MSSYSVEVSQLGSAAWSSAWKAGARSGGLEADEMLDETRLSELCHMVNGLLHALSPSIASHLVASKPNLRLSSSFSNRRFSFSWIKSSVRRERAAVRVSPANVS
jgi:hypothetical protein